MKRFTELFARGIEFVRDNPQIVYTLFLVFAIPLAFVATSDRFLSVARENQDRLEQSRVSQLGDTLALALPLATGTARAKETISALRSANETVTAIEVFVATSSVPAGSYLHLHSLSPENEGGEFTPDEISSALIRFAKTDPERTFAMAYVGADGRHWRGSRAILLPEGQGFATIDVSMAESDAISRRHIRDAYLILSLVVTLIILLLARQARIIDYSRLYARLKEVDRMKDDFVSMAAHELRSPLTVIRGYVEMLGEGEGLTEAGKGHLKMIDASAERLNSLIGDILDVAKLQEGRMSFTPERFEANETVRGIAEGYRHPAETKGLTLIVELGKETELMLDPTRFRQILTNLVGNAVKYTQKGEVRIVTEASKGRYRVKVSDTGLGISAESQKRLFEKFYRVKTDATAKIEGTGLGLWISAEMARAMAGDITVESIEGKGSVFIVSFPALG